MTTMVVMIIVKSVVLSKWGVNVSVIEHRSLASTKLICWWCSLCSAISSKHTHIDHKAVHCKVVLFMALFT